MNCLIPTGAVSVKYPFVSANALTESGNKIMCASGSESPFLSRTEPFTDACCAATNNGKQHTTMVERVFTI